MTGTKDIGAEYRKWAEEYLHECQKLKQKNDIRKCFLLSFDLLWKWKVTMPDGGE